MGERRAASRGRSRRSLCTTSWSCSCLSSSASGPCCGRCGGGAFLRPRPPAPRAFGLHGTSSLSSRGGPCSYRHLIHNFEEVLRRRLRGRMRASWLSPSVNSGIVVTAPKKALLGSETFLCPQRHKQKMKGDTVNVRRSVRVKTRVPWMPPGKTSCRESTYNWEGPTHRLEITPPDSEKLLSVLRLSDLSTDEEDAIHCKMNKYEKKIDSLLNVVGTLKNEVKMPKRDESRCVTKRLLDEQHHELDEVTQELVETEHENTVLRRNIERMKEEKDLSILQKRHLLHEKECLMAKLVEAELDGAAAAKQIQALRDAICKLKSEKNMTASDINTLTRQKELLLQKLSTFEETNRTLRDLLREQHSREKDSQKLTEQQGALMKRLTDMEGEKVQLLKRLQEKEKEIDDLMVQIQTEKDQAKTAAELAKSMEAVRGHLQAQLRNKEAENHRLGIQIRNLERVAAQHKAEVENIMEQLKELKAKGEREKEALKMAIKAQKERAERGEEYAEQLNAQLAEKDAYVAEALSTLESWRSRYNQVVKDKSDLEVEIVMLNSRIADLLDQQAHIEEKMREDRDALVDKLHRQATESTAFKMENERLRDSMIPVEERMNEAHNEVAKLKASLKTYESMIESYKNQVTKTRMESDEVSAKLETCEKENKSLKEEMSKEIDNVRKQFQNQLAELEKLPEVLKMTESKLAECQDQLKSYEKKNMDLSAMITDLRQRVRDWQKTPTRTSIKDPK